MKLLVKNIRGELVLLDTDKAEVLWERPFLGRGDTLVGPSYERAYFDPRQDVLVRVVEGPGAGYKEMTPREAMEGVYQARFDTRAGTRVVSEERATEIAELFVESKGWRNAQ